MIKELKDRRNKLLADAQKLMLQKDITTEVRSQFDAMIADADVIDADIKRLERVAQFEEEQRSAGRPPRSNPGEQEATPESNKAERRAFADYIRFGRVDSNVLRENRDLGTGAVAGAITGGSQLIPQAFYPVMTEAQKAWGALSTAVNQKKTDTGAPMNFRAGQRHWKSTRCDWRSHDRLVRQMPTLNGSISYTDFCTTGVIKVTLPELQDSAFDLDSFIKDSFGKRFYRGVANFITNGSSTGHVQSIVTSATVGATSAAPGAIAYADIVALYGALDPAYVETRYVGTELHHPCSVDGRDGYPRSSAVHPVAKLWRVRHAVGSSGAVESVPAHHRSRKSRADVR